MSFHTVLALAVSLCAVVVVAGDYQLPETVKTCNRDSDDFSSCLRLAIQEAWPTFVKGLPDFDMPPLDPYYTDSHSIEHESGQLRGKIIATDVRTYGLAKARFLSVKPEMADDFFRLEIDVDISKILIDGDYKAEGSLGAFKIGGKGFFNVSLEDVRCTWDISGHVADDRWVVEHFKMVPTVGNMRIWFSDLFNGNEDLNHAALVFINEYWPLVYRGMLPKMMNTWDEYLTEFTNRFFSKIPFSTVFP
ncbi:PREDICTED: circadian clock-controlled protein-like [Eufriesea mexicana]|uniref:circadian clock-controlled protein-like n=1 Tax=Eufriesea mexicana TaxID=516756 RepID=UPI00083BFF84|nr:PREDICTED: circadian clock-controlled protein-like [Eufriesea mexicana]